MDQFLEGIFSQLKAANGLDTTVNLNKAPVQQLVVPMGEALESEIEDRVARHKFMTQLEENLTRLKLIRTPDLGTLRVASVSDRMAVRRNRQTPFLNYLESQGQPAIVNDYQYLFLEWNIGEQTAPVWNVENDLPSEAFSNRPRRSNTLTCVGNKLNISLVAEQMALQQTQIDVMAREIDLETTRIRRSMNSLLLASVENKSEGQFGLPQLGGFITRSTLYNVNAGGGDLTRSLLQSRVDAIANNADPQGFGYGLPLLAFTNARQLQVLRDIIISEYNGIDPMSRMAYETELKSRLGTFAVDISMVFESMPGPVIPFVLESMLPTGTTIILDSDQPRLVKMRLNGQAGPWVLTRPTEKLQTLNVMFDLFSLEDPLVDTRAVITNHG